MNSTISDENIAKAVARLPSQGNNEIRTVLNNAEARGAHELVEACRQELTARGSLNLSGSDAQRHVEWGAAVKDMKLQEAIEFAFSKAQPPTDYEVVIVRAIASHPGISFQELSEIYGKGDLSLCIGHLVYDRFGCFRKWIEGEKDQSSVLMSKDRSGDSVRYRLKPEASEAFRNIGLV